MELTKGLFIGIDIGENVSQACFLDAVEQQPKSVRLNEISYYKNNPVSLSQIKDKLSSAKSYNIRNSEAQTQELYMQFAGHIAAHIADIIERVSKEAYNQAADKEKVVNFLPVFVGNVFTKLIYP